jgi:hypothetical protein
MDCASYIPPLEACSAKGSPVMDKTGVDIVVQQAKVRLALVAFAHASELSDAIMELGKACVAPEHMLIAGSLPALANAAQVKAETVLLMLGDMQLTQSKTASGPIYVSNPEAWEQAAAQGLLADRGLGGACRRGASCRTSLIDEIDNGSTVLMVRAESFSQQRVNVRILLKYGSSHVMTHDFANQPASRRPLAE